MPKIAIDFPLRGTWKVFHIPGHHRHAYDFVGLDAQNLKYLRAHAFKNIVSGGSVQDWYGWAEPVYSPTDGTVIQAANDWPDRSEVGFVRDFSALFLFRTTPAQNTNDPRSVAGNFVTIKRPDGIIVFMAHMKFGSVRVKPGDSVRAGEAIGQVGNSGNTLAPHLHLNLFEHTEGHLSGATILRYLHDPYVPPFVFRTFEQKSGDDWTCLTGSALRKGDIIRSTHV